MSILATAGRTVAFTICVTGIAACSGESEDAGPTTSQSAAQPKSPEPSKKPAKLRLAKYPANELDIESEGRVFFHRPSQTRFHLPDGWTAEPPFRQFDITVLKFADSQSGMRALITWAPLQRSLKQAVDRDRVVLSKNKTFGKRTVSVPRPVRIGSKTGWQTDVTSGPERNPTKREVVYIFATSPLKKNRWRVRLRVTFARGAKPNVGRFLAAHIRWPK